MKTIFYSRCGVPALLFLFVGVATAADNVIVPGVRCGAFILGKTTEKDLSAIPRTKELDFQFSRGGILDSVVVTSREYPTDRNVRVGATEEDVTHAYGQGKSGNIDLAKGDTVIGKVGDKVLFYPGIQFVFAKQRVWAIILVKK
jgi:hypothetical protein